jgi:hypothetical protein
MKKSQAPTKTKAAILFAGLLALLAVSTWAEPARAQYYGGYACPPGYYYAPGYACVPAYYGYPYGYGYAPSYGPGFFFGGVGVRGRGFHHGIAHRGFARGGVGRGGGHGHR